MASLTIRKLDDAIRDALRLRAARNGRSVEDEVRVILRDASQNGPASAAPATTARERSGQPARGAATELPRVTLIIGGGIAAYKALDLIRRLKERHLHVRCVLTKAAQQFVLIARREKFLRAKRPRAGPYQYCRRSEGPERRHGLAWPGLARRGLAWPGP